MPPESDHLAAYDVGPVRQLTPAQEDAIKTIAALPEGRGKVAAFLRCVLGEKSYFEIALMSHWLKNDKPLNEREMRYIAERWVRA